MFLQKMLNLMKFVFKKNFGTLYGLSKDLVTSKIRTTNANVDQIRFIVYLMMMGYYDKDFVIEGKKIYKEKSDSWQNKTLDIARIILKSGKEKALRSIKTFVPKNFKEGILKEQKVVLLSNKTI